LSGCAPRNQTPESAPGSLAATPTVAIPPPPFEWPEAANDPDQVPTHHVSLLTFGWPADLRIIVDRSVSTTLGVGDKPNVNKEALRYTLTTTQTNGGLRIAGSDVKLVVPNKSISARVQDAYNKAIEDLGSSIVPPFFVTEQGKFLRVENPDQVRDDINSMTQLFSASQTADSDGSPLGVRTTIKQEVTTENVIAQVAGEWNSLVGTWAGLTIKDRTPFPVTMHPPAGAANTQAPPAATGTVQFAGLAPCKTGDAEKKCVALELKLESDAEALKKAVNIGLNANAAPNYSGKKLETKLESVSQQHIARIITEPDGLRPHHAQFIDRTSIRIQLLSTISYEFIIQREIQLAFAYLSF
jgi:hypothetical protein